MAGEVHVLLGENGAGKSTLMKVLCGQHRKDSGTITFSGQTLEPTSPLAAEQLGLIMIHQELNLVPGLTVAENIFLGHEPTSMGLTREDAMRRDSRRCFARLRCDVDPDTPTAQLSVAEQQLVEIARALRGKARLLVMDEPTAALSDTEIEALFEVIRTLCQAGVPVIYISHRLNEILAIGDRITVMRDGHTVGTRDVKDDGHGRAHSAHGGPHHRRTDSQARGVRSARSCLQVEGLARTGKLSPVDLSIHSGEIVGVAGLMGSGRTELARAIFGADPIDAGTVRVAGKKLPGRNPAASIAAGLGFITEDRKQQGLVLLRSVAENITLTSLDDFTRLGRIDLEAERERAKVLVDRLDIRAASLEQKTIDLSGGNQQKVVSGPLAGSPLQRSALRRAHPGHRCGLEGRDLLPHRRAGRAQGVAVLLISSELTELLGLADRVAVMHEGTLQGIVPRAEASQERIMRLALGQGPPGAPHVSDVQSTEERINP